MVEICLRTTQKTHGLLRGHGDTLKPVSPSVAFVHNGIKAKRALSMGSCAPIGYTRLFTQVYGTDLHRLGHLPPVDENGEQSRVLVCGPQVQGLRQLQGGHSLAQLTTPGFTSANWSGAFLSGHW